MTKRERDKMSNTFKIDNNNYITITTSNILPSLEGWENTLSGGYTLSVADFIEIADPFLVKQSGVEVPDHYEW